jgi:hypothetical protein
MRRYVNIDTATIVALWIVCGLFWIGFWYGLGAFLWYVFSLK